MSENSFIPGIFNHCDRWCERCHFTNKCRVFHENRKQFSALEDKEDFMSIISQNLSNVKDMLQTMAKEKGLDLKDLSDEKAYEEHQRKTKQAREHNLSQMAKDYAKLVNKWLESNQHLQIYRQKLEEQLALGISPEENDKAQRLMDEALKIIQWYLFQIHVKLSSAIRYYPHDPEFEDEINNMHHSSAKIALIGIKNSMKAWHSLWDYLHDDEDFILEILLMLKQIETQIHQKFPLLHKYRRPIFED
jgi:hypothetical protein